MMRIRNGHVDAPCIDKLSDDMADLTSRFHSMRTGAANKDPNNSCKIQRVTWIKRGALCLKLALSGEILGMGPLRNPCQFDRSNDSDGRNAYTRQRICIPEIG